MAPLLSLLFFISALVLFLKLHGNKSKKTNLPPSPPKLPIIGNLHQLGALPHRSFRSLAQKHGPLMLLHLGQIPTLVISSAEMAEEIMKKHDHIFASRPSSTAAKQLYYGCVDIAFAPYSEYWRQARKITVLELLSTKRVNSFRSIREEEVGLLIKKISDSCSTCAAIKLSDMLLSLSSSTIMRIAFGRKYKGEGEEGTNKFTDLVEELSAVLASFFVGDYFPSLAWVDVVTGMDARLKRNCRGLDALLEQVIDDHLARRKMNSGIAEEHKDLVDVLLDVQDSMLGIKLTSENVKAIILDMFNGGTDTTALTLEWAMAELIKHPHVMEKAQEEIRRVVWKSANVKEEDLHQLHYLKLIVKETLRLHPIVPLLVPRESMADVVIGGYDIPAKTRVFTNVWAIGRDPNLWENAEEFIPERFANNSIDFKGQDFQFIPFGAGRRGCPGMLFGITSVEFTLANLLYWFDWKLPMGLAKEDLDLSEALGITAHMKFPLHLVPKQHFYS